MKRKNMGITETQNVKIMNAEPAGLGLFGLAMVTLVASSQKLGLASGVSLIIPWAIFLGAFAQLFACISDSKRNNIFGMTAFGAYAFFWFGVAATWMIRMGVFGEVMARAADPRQLGVAFIGYFIFSLYMTVAAMETNKVLFIIFVLIDILFVSLSLDAFGILPGLSPGVAAYAELSIAIVSFYGSAATVMNQHFGRVFLPVGKPFGIFKEEQAHKTTQANIAISLVK